MAMIDIPQDKEQILTNLKCLCMEKEATEPLPPVYLELKTPPTKDEEMWYRSQSLPGRYAGYRIDYDSSTQELSVAAPRASQLTPSPGAE